MNLFEHSFKVVTHDRFIELRRQHANHLFKPSDYDTCESALRRTSARARLQPSGRPAGDASASLK